MINKNIFEKMICDELCSIYLDQCVPYGGTMMHLSCQFSRHSIAEEHSTLKPMVSASEIHSCQHMHLTLMLIFVLY